MWELLNAGETVTANVCYGQLERLKAAIVEKHPVLIEQERCCSLTCCESHATKNWGSWVGRCPPTSPYSSILTRSPPRLITIFSDPCSSLLRLGKNSDLFFRREENNAMVGFFDSKTSGSFHSANFFNSDN